ncbi:hypothetical protein IW261DRAFT_1555453 [Armillaria novae-zelandiae]|uniref:Uncharacterized protein n=1 Tax=Armillaria novae-zelandiae TaxID=153914 RepID=A0AA39PUD0_9AGAR|nr:hypothetical protein IW261DRAFT_1555453 [Armillaria novae-zelandiae]
MGLATYDEVNNINASGVFLCMREQLKVMRDQEAVGRIPGRPGVRGAIVNMSSTCMAASPQADLQATLRPNIRLQGTKAAAISHSVDGIRVNAVCPGFIDTPMVESVEEHFDFRALLEIAVPMKVGQASCGNFCALTVLVSDLVWMKKLLM